MKKGRNLLAAVIFGTAAIGLTACDPPMPPEVAAALAEQTYTCIPGEASVSADAQMQDLLLGWADSLSYSCVDPEPTMTLAIKEPKDANVQISTYAPTCSPVNAVPFAVEAAVVVYMQSEVSSLNLSAKSISEIISGKITNWNQLAKDNPGYEMPDFPLTVLPTADDKALSAMNDYLAAQGVKPKSSLFSAQAQPALDQYAALAEGQVAIVPNSYAVTLGLYPANIYLGLDADQYPIVATPDVAGIQSASTQWVVNKSSNGLTVALDNKKEPTPPEGSDVAPSPYQAIYPVNLNICKDELLSRAVARFLLRLDSQGAIAASNFAPLPEFARIDSLLNVSVGLPTPKPTE